MLLPLLQKSMCYLTVYTNTIYTFIAPCYLLDFDGCDLTYTSVLVKGVYLEVQESAILEGYRCKADKCSGFLLRDSGML